MVGVASKVTKCLSAGLDKKKSEKLNFEDPMEWESKTITSAAKTFLRNLPEPLMTFRMHSSFIAAASKLIFLIETPKYNIYSEVSISNRLLLFIIRHFLQLMTLNRCRLLLKLGKFSVLDFYLMPTFIDFQHFQKDFCISTII